MAFLLLWTAVCALLLWQARKRLGTLPRLPESVPAATAAPGGTAPRVSAIVPARNEANAIEPAMASLLAQTYPHLEIIAVNDHSSDTTGEILERLAAGDDRLHVIHDPPLPPGWLGKPNAMHAGAEQARGEWLVFADADIVFKPAAFERAIGAAMAQEVDGITLMPRLDNDVWAVGAQYPWLVPFGIIVLRPQEANRKAGEAFAAGAFILIKRSVYDAVGGHRTLRTAVLDDVEFARLIKGRGYRFRVYDGHDVARVTLYRGVGEFFYGMVKNVSYLLGGREGKPWLAPLGALVLALFVSVPVLGAVVAAVTLDGLLAMVSGVAYLVPILFSWSPIPMLQAARRHLFLYPVAVWAIPGAVLTASYYRLRHGAILWRGRKVVLDKRG